MPIFENINHKPLKHIMNIRQILFVVSSFFLFELGLHAQSVTAGRQMDDPALADTTGRSIAGYFTPVTKNKKTPDANGFIQRWLLLEPISKPIRSNTDFTDSYLRKAFDTLYFPNQFTILPKNGETVTVADKELTWHALDSKLWNVKLFRFAFGLNKPIYGVVFWAVTIVDCSQEMKNVRMAVGSNSASMWWLNGEEAVLLSGDRRMVMDDVISTRVTLKKGKNVIRGVVINGPGMSDFCVRFLDEKGEPIKNFTIIGEQ